MLKKKTGIAIGVLVSIIGFILAVISVVIETHIHNEVQNKQTDISNYTELMFRKSLLSSFGEICIFLGFLTMNYIVLIHLWKQF
jgi:Ca2+/Na+ antiporter